MSPDSRAFRKGCPSQVLQDGGVCEVYVLLRAGSPTEYTVAATKHIRGVVTLTLKEEKVLEAKKGLPLHLALDALHEGFDYVITGAVFGASPNF